MFNLVKGEDTENVKEDGIKLTTSEVVLLPQLHLMSAGSRLSRLSQKSSLDSEAQPKTICN